MDPVSIALLSVVIFGVVGIFTAFIHQLLLSREKKLNDALQFRALEKETRTLSQLRHEMLHAPRFKLHHDMLGNNKESILRLDERIEEVFQKKSNVIHRYAEVMLHESQNIIESEQPVSRKKLCNSLHLEMDKELEHYEHELEQLQKRRSYLWDTNQELQKQLISQEQGRNKNLDTIYTHHTGVLEKVYLRHNENSEKITQKTIEEGSSTLKSMLAAPLQLLTAFFGLSTGIAAKQPKRESDGRLIVKKWEYEINVKAENTLENSIKDDKDDELTERVY